ncbi:glycosyltransferase [Coprobacter tertius]|uniref:Glycosyltransferase n=1 Tax=Coprobacter tertius TaxID=2944915 RepID=A0ABT1MDS6_9BACT|nr:glycosyltransferase [Coprobacter tertius]MCP9610792.1 glycosyltransferase [Coprobacter tertius]
MPFFSVIVPVYNRPDEINELLETLTRQTDLDFEVIVVEDGSSRRCEDIVKFYDGVLDITYYEKTNTGPGGTRNYGAQRANGEYFVFFDSDCLIPEGYFSAVKHFLKNNYVDLYGGPDREHRSFSPIQKAINYSMTAMLTTGGIRGKKTSMEKFNPRSFNMGISKRAFDTVGGFSGMRAGEDIDMSLRIRNAGFESALISEAFVYHKRRVDFGSFFCQVKAFGGARIDLFRKYPYSLKPVHLLPAVFVLGTVFLIVFSFFQLWALLPLGLYFFGIFVESLWMNRSVYIAILSIPAAVIQLGGYGIGFLNAAFKKLVLNK